MDFYSENEAPTMQAKSRDDWQSATLAHVKIGLVVQSPARSF
jgi:hypothetical protein